MRRYNQTYKRLIQSAEWRRVRMSKLQSNPICERCNARGRVKAANCVHHLTPVESAKSDGEAAELCYSMSNLQSLCYECHAEIHKAHQHNDKAAHKQRASESASRWLARHGVKDPGAVFFSPPPTPPKFTAPFSRREGEVWKGGFSLGTEKAVKSESEENRLGAAEDEGESD